MEENYKNIESREQTIDKISQGGFFSFYGICSLRKEPVKSFL